MGEQEITDHIYGSRKIATETQAESQVCCADSDEP